MTLNTYGQSGLKARDPKIYKSSPGGKFGSPKQKPQLVGGLSMNPNTGEYMYGGEKVSKEKGAQGLSAIRDRLRNEGHEGNFNEEFPVEEGFLPVSDKSKKELDSKLGYGQGLIDTFMGRQRKTKEKMMKSLAAEKDPKKRAELSKKWQEYHNNAFPRTEAADVSDGIIPTLTGTGRALRDIASRDTGLDIAGQAVGGLIGSAAGPVGTVVGRGVGSQLVKEVYGNESMANDAYFQLAEGGVDITNKEVNIT